MVRVVLLLAARGLPLPAPAPPHVNVRAAKARTEEHVEELFGSGVRLEAPGVGLVSAASAGDAVFLRPVEVVLLAFLGVGQNGNGVTWRISRNLYFDNFE